MQKKFICGWAVGLCVAGAAHADQVLYDVDFSAPFHTVGQEVSTDTGDIVREGPYRNNFDAPIVVDSYGEFVDGAARFEVNSAGSFYLSQFELGIESQFTGVGVDSSAYSLEFDLIIDRLEGSFDSFTIFFDVPTIKPITFQNGRIRHGTQLGLIGAYQEDVAMHVAVDFFGDDEMWKIKIDDQILYSGSLPLLDFHSYEELRDIRLSLSNHSDADVNSVVYVDNIVIRAIPTPSVLCVFGALPMMRTGRRRKLS